MFPNNTPITKSNKNIHIILPRYFIEFLSVEKSAANVNRIANVIGIEIPRKIEL